MTNDPEAALSDHAAYERNGTDHELTTTVFDTVEGDGARAPSAGGGFTYDRSWPICGPPSARKPTTPALNRPA